MLSLNQQKKKQKIPNINKIIKVEIPAGGAAVTPPLGPVLGQYGMNTMEFCKEFNEESKSFEKDTILPTTIYLALDKSFYFELRSPGVAYFIKKYLESNEIEKKNDIYQVDKVLFLQFLYEVALFKITLIDSDDLKDLNLDDMFMQNTIRSMLGTARSFGIKFI